jgi:hypothetical protein
VASRRKRYKASPVPELKLLKAADQTAAMEDMAEEWKKKTAEVTIHLPSENRSAETDGRTLELRGTADSIKKWPLQ